MNAHIKRAIEILEQADRNEMSVPERRLYDAAMESYRYLPQAELLHAVEKEAERINFRYPIAQAADDHVDFTASIGREDRRAQKAVAKWIESGWDAKLIEAQRRSALTGRGMTEFIIRVKRGK